MTVPEAICDAVAAGDFSRAAQLFAEYTRGVSARLQNGAAGAVEVERARAILDWCRLMMFASRAHLADRLAALRTGAHVTRAYGKEPATPRG